MNTQTLRLSRILKIIEINGSADVAELAKDLQVSEMTIRRDFEDLEKAGLIRRVHGGATILSGRNYEPPYYLRSEEHKEAKGILGKFAAGLVVEGDSISLDVGSTIYEIAMNLVKRKNLTVITPSFHIANLLLQQPDIRIIIPGGILRHTEASLIGEIAQKSISGFYVDKLFLGIGGIEASAGLTEFNVDDTQVKQALIKNAKEVIVVADAAKFQKIAFSLIGPLNVMNELVTNAYPPEPLLSALINNHVVINIVERIDGVEKVTVI